MELNLLFSLSLLAFPILVSANNHNSKPPWEAELIVALSVVFLLFVAVVGYYIHRYGNGCLGAGIDRLHNDSQEKAARGLDASVVGLLPAVRFSEIRAGVGEGQQVEMECAVCLCDFEVEDVLRVLPECLHVFHSDCLEPWLLSHVTCPVCRASLEHVTGSGVSLPNLLERLSTEASDYVHPHHPHHHHHDLDVKLDINRWTTNQGPTRGWQPPLPRRAHSTGDLIILIEKTTRKNSLPKEMSPKSGYRERNLSDSNGWGCFLL